MLLGAVVLGCTIFGVAFLIGYAVNELRKQKGKSE